MKWFSRMNDNNMIQDIELARKFGFQTHQSFFNVLVRWGVLYEHCGSFYPVRELGQFKPVMLEYRHHRTVIWFQPWVVDFIRHCRDVDLMFEE